MRLISELFDDEDQLTSAPTTSEMAPFADIPSSIWTAFLFAWGSLFAIFILVFATDGRATLDVLTAAFFALMTLGLPAALGTRARCVTGECPQFIGTHTGRLSIGAVATQILLIPVAAVIGLTAFVLLAM